MVKKSKIPIWDRPIYVVIGGGEKDVEKLAKKLRLSKTVIDEIKDDFHLGELRGAAYFCLDKGIGIYYHPGGPVNQYTIIHECLHILDWLSEFIGLETEKEARSYTMEWLVMEMKRLLGVTH